MRFHIIATLFIILLSSSTLFAQSQLATANMKRSPAATKVKRQQAIEFSIAPSGEFHGVVADRTGTPKSDVDFLLLSKTSVVGVSRTDKDGRFAFTNVTPGARTLRTADAAQRIRLWPADVAPPNAKSGILLVTGDSTVRGQCCSAGANCGGCDSCSGAAACGAGYPGQFGGVFQHLLQSPWLIGAGTAAAIAIPLATDDDDQRDDDFTNQIEVSDDTVVDGGSGEPAS